MHRNPETLTTFFSSGTKRLLTFLIFIFLTWGERHSFYYADCSNIVLQSTPSWLSGPESKSQLASPRVKISTAFFQKSPKFPAHSFQAWRHSHPSPIFHLGFLLWHLWLSHPLRASVNTCTKSRSFKA